MKKVLIITYYWPPSGGAGVQRWVKFVKYLSAMNIEPLVLTVHPDTATYPQKDPSLASDIPDTVQVFYAKSFELYNLYKRFSSNKEVPYGGFANTKKLDFKEKVIRFLRGNLIIPDPRRGWNKYALAKAKELIHSQLIDNVITTSPPHSTQLIGLKLKKELGIRWITDLRDPWTDIYYFKQMYPTFIATQIHQYLEKKVLRNADRIITVSEELKKLFAEKADNISDKIKVIPNGYDTADFKGLKNHVHPEMFYLTYAGTLSKEYNTGGFIKALQELPEEIRPVVKVRFIGQMPSELWERFEAAGIGNMVELKGYVPHASAIEYMMSSDLLLLIIPDVKNNEGILTGKLFEYLGSGKQILFIGPKQGDAAKVIRKTNSGIICSYDEHQQMAKEITRLYLLKKSGAQVSASHDVTMYSRENLTKELLKLL
jgi:glycosyltransferase involved in cell wall biosynthesis